MNPELRTSVEDMLKTLAYDKTLEYRELSALAKLLTRIRFMTLNKVHRHTYIDNSLITNLEYQAFLEDMKKKGKIYYPDHWITLKYEDHQAFDPIVGIRPYVLEDFFQWISDFDIGPTNYRAPSKTEADLIMVEEEGRYTYFIQENSLYVYRSPQQCSFLFKDTESTIKLLEDDISDIERLYFAVEYRQRTIPTTSELLSRVINNPLSGGWFTKKSGIGLSSLFGSEIDKIRENRVMLEDYEIFGKQLDLDIVGIVNRLHSVFSNPHKETKQYSLFETQVKFDTVPFTIDQYCQHAIRLFTEKEIRDALDNETRFVWFQLEKALAHIHTRDWMKSFTANSDIKTIYHFLRWLIRISVNFILVKAWEKQRAGISFTVQQHIFTEMKNLLSAFIALENTIRGNRQPINGIRLVKEEKRI